MKILTNKQYEELLERTRTEAYCEGFDDGRKLGDEAGYHRGLKQDASGVVWTGRGIHFFDGDTNTETLG